MNEKIVDWSSAELLQTNLSSIVSLGNKNLRTLNGKVFIYFKGQIYKTLLIYITRIGYKKLTI